MIAVPGATPEETAAIVAALAPLRVDSQIEKAPASRWKLSDRESGSDFEALRAAKRGRIV